MTKLKNFLLAAASGALAVLTLVVIYLLKTAKPVVNAEQYVANLEQKVAKIKQKGEGNTQTTDISQELSKKEQRQQARGEKKNEKEAKKTARKARRKAVLSDNDENNEI